MSNVSNEFLSVYERQRLGVKLVARKLEKKKELEFGSFVTAILLDFRTPLEPPARFHFYTRGGVIRSACKLKLRKEDIMLRSSRETPIMEDTVAASWLPHSHFEASLFLLNCLHSTAVNWALIW
mgnify:CR=1 FL=1